MIRITNYLADGFNRYVEGEVSSFFHNFDDPVSENLYLKIQIYNRLLSKFALPEKIEDFFEGSNSADETYTRCISESAEFDPSEKDRF